MILKSGKVGLVYKKYGSYLNGTIVQEIEIKSKEIITYEGKNAFQKVPILLKNDFLSQNKTTNYHIVAVDYALIFKLDFQDFF
jgi:hypothetical protein